MTETLNELSDLTEDQLAADPRIGMGRLAFEFLLQQEYFGTAAMMVAEFIASIQRIEAAENSGYLRVKFIVPITSNGDTSELHAWYDVVSDTASVPPRLSMRNLTNKSDAELRELLQLSRQTLTSLAQMLGDRPDMENTLFDVARRHAGDV